MFSKSEYADHRGVSRACISKDIKKGIIVVDPSGKIDPEHPVNVAYTARPRRKPNGSQRPAPNPEPISKLPPKETPTPRGNTTPSPTPKPKPKPRRKKPKDNHAGDFSSEDFDPTQKLYEETRWKKAQADMKSLEYAEKLGVMNDNTALDNKFGTFVDFLLNDLIYFPEESSDILWAEASTSEDPVKTLEDGMKKRVAKIIEGAQEAARKVLPPKGEVSYIFIDDNE